MAPCLPCYVFCAMLNIDRRSSSEAEKALKARRRATHLSRDTQLTPTQRSANLTHAELKLNSIKLNCKRSQRDERIQPQLHCKRIQLNSLARSNLTTAAECEVPAALFTSRRCCRCCCCWFVFRLLFSV